MARVLIVDDSASQRYSLEKLMQSWGYETLTAEDGQQALEIATAELPDIILMDVVMPGMSGFQTTRQLSRNEHTCNIPVIFVTTRGEETDRFWGMRQGAAAYITKPVNPDLLSTAITEAMAA
jgi:twitching motility two-component system response regulator PilH